MIVAFSTNRVIGRDGDLPWRLSSDLKRFKRLTMGHHIIMGRKTFESIGRALPGRTSVVLTRSANWKAVGTNGDDQIIVVQSVEEMLQVVADDSEPFVIGGAEVFEMTLPMTRKMYISRVDAIIDGDCYFPEVDWIQWRLESAEQFPADKQNEFAHTFEIHSRIVTS